MAQEDKQLLLKDLCARLPYKLICNVTDYTAEREEDENFDACLLSIERTDSGGYATFRGAAPEYPVWHNLQQLIKPYLRPMSSMTAEESSSLGGYPNDGCMFPEDAPEYIDWLNEHHFDYRGLIEKGLALEAPKDMYKN